MDSFETIKQIWTSEKALDLPNSNDIKSALEKYHSSKKRNIYLLIVALVLCLVLFVLVIVFNKSLLWTTTLGEILILIGFVLGISQKLKTLKKTHQNELKSNKDFLEDLKIAVRKKSKANLLQIIAMFLLSVGYAFYIYEIVRKNNTTMLVSYLGIILFLLGVYFVFRPFTNKKSRKKSAKLLNDIEAFNSQI